MLRELFFFLKRISEFERGFGDIFERVELGDDEDNRNSNPNKYKVIANNYGWWWTVKVMCEFDPFKEDLIYKWNVRRFYNQIVFIQDMEKVKEIEIFENQIKRK